MNESNRTACINLDVFASNITVIKNHLDRHGQKANHIMACIKSNAYGHGLIPTALALANSGCSGFAVADLSDALQLRKDGLKQRILLMSSTLSDEALYLISEHQIDWVVFHPQHLQQIESIQLEKPIQIWLKINTGMNRMGIDPQQANEAISRLQHASSTTAMPFLMSHFASADQKPSEHVATQYSCFLNTIAHHQASRSLANSAAILNYPETAFEWSRPGIVLYGGSPLPNTTGKDLNLTPAMEVNARLLTTHRCLKGESVGYSGWWQCKEDTPIGIVSFGYADGYPRQMPHGAPVMINGQQARTLGRISMDTLIVDLSNCPNAKIGDWVTLWGPDLPAETIAKRAGTSMYQLCCSLSQRTQFIYQWKGRSYRADRIVSAMQMRNTHEQIT
jgi:alanine racemase